MTSRGVCKEDPGNLNAWANLGYVYDKLGRELDTAECVEKVSHLMGLDGGGASQEETRLLAARCLAEQAYVFPHDVELDSQDVLRERLTEALSRYNRALDYGGQLVRLDGGWITSGRNNIMQINEGRTSNPCFSDTGRRKKKLVF